MKDYTKERLSRRSDAELVKIYFDHPKKSIITNLLFLAIAIAVFVYVFSLEVFEIYHALLFGVVAVFAYAAQVLVPALTRKTIRSIFAERHTNVYDAARVVNYKVNPKTDKNLSIINTVILVICQIVYLFTALLISAIVGILAIFFYLLSLFLYLIFHLTNILVIAEFFYGLSNFFVKPILWAWTYLWDSLTFKLVRGAFDKDPNGHLFSQDVGNVTVFESDPTRMDKTQSDLNIKEFVHLNGREIVDLIGFSGIKSHSIDYFTSETTTSALFYTLKLSIEVYSDIIHIGIEADNLKAKIASRIESKAESLVMSRRDKFLNKYPNASKEYKVYSDIEITFIYR